MRRHKVIRIFIPVVSRWQFQGKELDGWDLSGQIIATSHDLTSHGRVVGEPCLKWPYFREIQVGEIL